MKQKNNNLVENTLLELALFLLFLFMFGYLAYSNALKSAGEKSAVNSIDTHYVANGIKKNCKPVNSIVEIKNNEYAKYINSTIIFESRRYEIDNNNNSCAKEICLQLIDIIRKNRDEIDEIVMDGHASSEYEVPSESCGRDKFMCNMNLSTQRAFQMYLKCWGVMNEVYDGRYVDRDSQYIGLIDEFSASLNNAFMDKNEMEAWYQRTARPMGHSSAQVLFGGDGIENVSELDTVSRDPNTGNITVISGEGDQNSFFHRGEFTEVKEYSRRVEIHINGRPGFLEKLRNNGVVASFIPLGTSQTTGSVHPNEDPE